MFFFPYADDNPTARTPILSWALMGLCCLIFLWQLGLGENYHQAILQFGVIPAALFGTAPTDQTTPAIFTIFSSMFLHGGFAHLLGNMVYLWIFGDNVEDSLGRRNYLLLYLVSGVAAALMQSIIAPDSVIPMIGASGAIAGVLGAYLVLHPLANVRCIIGFFIFFRVINVPAFIILCGWLLMQFLSLGQLDSQSGGVAYVAHIGGFLAGVSLIFLLKKPNMRLFAPARSRAFSASATRNVLRRSPHLPRSDRDG